jgi:hypothetical protein
MKFFRILGTFNRDSKDQILKLGSMLDYSSIPFTAVLFGLKSILWPYRGIDPDSIVLKLRHENRILFRGPMK